MDKIVWVSEPIEGYVKGTVVDIGNNTMTVKLTSSIKTIVADYDQIFPVEVEERDVDDNCSLMFLNSPNLLNNIKIRYMRNCIYTYVANILIAINPYYDIPNLYTKEIIKKYKGKSIGTLPPHVYSIADQAYRNMKTNKMNQSIVVSGESGAGKTETTKYIIQYITDCYGARAGPIEQRINESNPLLEAFGNAKTVRNNNSSRCGKFVEIHFDKNMLVAGGFISHYLLEKSRICKQAPTERNYHIFYRMCAGMPQKERENFDLKSPDNYNYLKNGTTRYFCSKNDTSRLANDIKSAELLKMGCLNDIQLNDITDYARTYTAMKDMGISDKECQEIFGIVAGILHLGNIEFEEVNTSQGGCQIREISQSALQSTCRLLGFEPKSLAESLCNKFTSAASKGAQNTALRIALKPEDAQSARDALSKAIYLRLFDEIVGFVNRALPFKDSVNYVGILDIAGFEYFEKNSFEQFCINYCNEKLQQFFNERVLIEEQILYEKEGLGITKIKFIDNQDCIDLIERKSSGIIDILDEESKLPKPSADHFTDSIFTANSNHFRLQLPRKSKLKIHREIRDNEGFLIRHFAGAVCYHTEEFIEKNNDALHDSLKTLLETSTILLMQKMFEKEQSHGGLLTSTANKKGHGTGKLSFISVASNFRSQLSALMEKLRKSDSNFIRCIKPNVSMVAKSFEGGSILSQLQCSGMTVVLDLMQQGYPSRIRFIDLYNIYQKLLPADLAKLDQRLFCKLLFKAVGLNVNDFQFGMTKVFFRPGKMAEFDQLIRSDPENVKVLIAKVRKWLIKYRWRKAQYGVWEVIKLKNKIIWRRSQIIKIQKTIRMWLVKKKYGPKLKSFKKLRELHCLFDKISLIANQLKGPNNKGQKMIEENKKKYSKLEFEIKNMPLSKSSSINKLIETFQLSLNEDINFLKKEVQTEKINSEKEKLKKIQDELELQRQRAEEEKRCQKLENDEKQLKLEFEKNRKKEAEKLEKIKINTITTKGQKETEDYINEMTKEQERRDKELALRIAEGDTSVIEELTINRSRSPNIANEVAEKSYNELRKIINTSCDVKLIEACQAEFHRRVNAYNNWKSKQNEKKQANAVKLDIGDNSSELKTTVLSSSNKAVRTKGNEQRYFTLPFKAANGKATNGTWWGHFDGEYIARQIEIHDKETHLLLLAGIDDLAMCDLPLSITGLLTRKGAEITEGSFEETWKSYGGIELIQKMAQNITSSYLKSKFL